MQTSNTVENQKNPKSQTKIHVFPSRPKKKKETQKARPDIPSTAFTISRCPETERFHPSKKQNQEIANPKNQNNSRYAVGVRGVCVEIMPKIRKERISIYACHPIR